MWREKYRDALSSCGFLECMMYLYLLLLYDTWTESEIDFFLFIRRGKLKFSLSVDVRQQNQHATSNYVHNSQQNDEELYILRMIQVNNTAVGHPRRQDTANALRCMYMGWVSSPSATASADTTPRVPWASAHNALFLLYDNERGLGSQHVACQHHLYANHASIHA